MISNREGREWLLKQLYDRGIKYITNLRDTLGYIGLGEKPERQADGSTIICNKYFELDGISALLPDFNEPHYLDVGKYLGITDWSEVATDTPVYAKLYDGGIWYPLHFAKYENGDAYVYTGGRTSWSKEVKDAVSNMVAKAYEIRLAEGGKP